MSRKTSIIYMTEPPECWADLKKFCEGKGLKYNTVSKKTKELLKNGLEFKGIKYYKVKNKE